MKDTAQFTGLLIMALIGHFQDQWRALTPRQRTLVIEDVRNHCIEAQLSIRDAVRHMSRRTTTLDAYAMGLLMLHGEHPTLLQEEPCQKQSPGERRSMVG